VREADDTVQEGWLRASRANTSDVGNTCAWLTTVAARVSLNMLRLRRSKRRPARHMALGVSRHVRGAETVARQARMHHTLDRFSRPALVNGTPRIVVASGERIYAVMGFTDPGGKIVAIDTLRTPRGSSSSLSPERSLAVGRTGEVTQLAQIKRHRREPRRRPGRRAVCGSSNGTLAGSP
jgi:hypothetical protein